MNSSWKVRIILALGIGIIVFGDYLGYGNGSATVGQQHLQQKRSINDQNNIINDNHKNSKEGNNNYNDRVEGNCFV